MILTFGQLLATLSPYIGRAGSCDTTDPATRLKVASLLQEYVMRAGSLRKWNLTTRSNSFTLPKDLAIILKVKVNGVTEQPLSTWYEFFDNVGGSDMSCYDSQEWANGVIQEVNNYPTVYDHTGGYVLAELGKKCGKSGSITTIQGVDEKGEDIYTKHKGALIHGELLSLEPGVTKRTNRYFSKIISITKDVTDDYVRYLSQGSKGSQPSLLSLLAAKETTAQFRRAKIVGTRCHQSNCYSITILGRVEIQSDYHNNDIVPITELGGVEALAQAKQSVINNNIAAAGFKFQVVDRNIEDANMYNRSTDSTFDIVKDLSAGDIDHLS